MKNYHVHLRGQSLGVLPLDELRRRRESGEFTGEELVWCEGMADWQPIETVLRQPPDKVPPTSGPGPKADRKVLLAIGAIALVLVAGLAVWGVLNAKRMPAIEDQSETTPPPNPDAMAAASRPVLQNTNALTAKDMLKRAKEFRVRQWIEGYQKRGRHDQPCDALALRFLHAWLVAQYGGEDDTDVLTHQQLADKIAEDPACADPLVLTLAGSNSIEENEAVVRLERAVSGFENSKHLAYPKFNATVMLASHLRSKPEQIPALDAASIRHFEDGFKDGSFLPDDQRELGEILVNGWAYSFFTRNAPAVIGTVQQQGTPFEWLALVLEGENEIALAWKARGAGYVNTVSQSGWQGFSTHLATARKSLTAAWKLFPDLALAPCRMIYVSLGDSNIEEMRTWFDRTVAAQVDCPRAWSDMRWGLRPRWYGGQEAMLAFGLTAANTRRFDTDVPRILFDSVSDMESELSLPVGEHIYGRDDIWPHLRKMYEGYIAEPAQAAWTNGWRTSFATVAYFAEKYDVAREQLEAMQWQPAAPQISGWGRDLSLMPLEVAARTGPLAGHVGQAEASYKRQDTAAALRLYRDISADPKADPRTLQLAQSRLACLQAEDRLRNGEWIDFAPADPNDPAWLIERGEVRQMTNGAFEVRSGPWGHFLSSRVRVGPDFEVRGEFQAVNASTNSFQAGVILGAPDVQAHNWYSFRIKRNEFEHQVVSFANGWTRQQVARPVALDPARTSFDFRFERGLATASVNGQEILSGVKPPQAIRVSPREFRVGVGAFNDSNETVIRYAHLQLRRINSHNAQRQPAEAEPVP